MVSYDMLQEFPFLTDQVQIGVSAPGNKWVEIDAIRLIGRTVPKGKRYFISYSIYFLCYKEAVQCKTRQGVTHAMTQIFGLHCCFGIA